jgi:DNA-binding MarR family transcriptional regulator
MRTTVTADGLGEAFGAPRPPDSLAEMARSLSVLVGRRKMIAYLGRLVAELGIDLPLPDCWVLVQLRRNPGLDRPGLMALAQTQKMTSEGCEAAIEDLISKSLVTRDLELTPAGREIADQLTSAVRDRLEALLQGWSPEQYPDLVHLLDQFATEILSEPTVAQATPAGVLGP